MTKQERKQYASFLEEVLDHRLDIPPDDLESRPGSVCLFNPRLPLFYILRYFEQYGAGKSIKNVVDPEVFESQYFTIHRFDTPYFFVCTDEAPLVLLGQNSIQNMTGLVGSLDAAKDQTMTVVEAVLYMLYSQFMGSTTELSCNALVTLTTNTMQIPLVVGFDEDEICNRVRFYNAREMLGASIGTKEVHATIAR